MAGTPPTAPILGANGKLYRNVGTFITPVWVLMSSVRDVDFPLSYKEYDATARLSGGFEQTEPTLGQISGDLEMMWDPSDPHCIALLKAAWTRQAVCLLNLDSDIAQGGFTGFAAFFKVFKSGRPEKRGDYMSQIFSLKLCYSAAPPAFFMLGGLLVATPLQAAGPDRLRDVSPPIPPMGDSVVPFTV